jgi:hypothetical protein
MTTTILSNASVTKLKENSRSYGGPETIEAAYLLVTEKDITLIHERGFVGQTLRRGTKKLISFGGTEITKQQFDQQIKSAKKDWADKQEAQRIENEENKAIAKAKGEQQLKQWEQFLTANPEKAAKYRAKCEGMNSSKKKSYVMMKAAEKINNESFSGLFVSAGELMAKLHSLA